MQAQVLRLFVFVMLSDFLLLNKYINILKDMENMISYIFI